MNPTTDQMIAEYRAARSAYIAACEQSDRAFARWMNGEVKTARGAGRLAAKVEQTGGEVDYRRHLLLSNDIDVSAIDAADGLCWKSYDNLYFTTAEVGA